MGRGLVGCTDIASAATGLGWGWRRVSDLRYYTNQPAAVSAPRSGESGESATAAGQPALRAAGAIPPISIAADPCFNPFCFEAGVRNVGRIRRTGGSHGKCPEK